MPLRLVGSGAWTAGRLHAAAVLRRQTAARHGGGSREPRRQHGGQAGGELELDSVASQAAGPLGSSPGKGAPSERALIAAAMSRGVCVGDPQNGVTPLLLAVERGMPDMAKLLLDHGADIEAKQRVSACGRTAGAELS